MKLEYTTTGSGPPAVVLHGLFGSGENLRRVAGWLEDRHTVYLPDLPNHGGSPHTPVADYPSMVESVARFVEEHDLSPVVMAGHSMGGKVAMCLALSRPELVRSLIVLDMAPRRYPPSHTAILDALSRLDVAGLSNRRDADQALASSISSPAIRAFLLKNLQKTDDGYAWRLNLPVISRDYENILLWTGEGEYAGAALFVGGSESTYLQRDRDTAIIRRYFPEATIRIVQGAGHWIHVDAPEEVGAAIGEFLDSVSRS